MEQQDQQQQQQQHIIPNIRLRLIREQGFVQTYIFILKTKQLKNYKRIFYPSILIFMGT